MYLEYMYRDSTPVSEFDSQMSKLQNRAICTSGSRVGFVTGSILGEVGNELSFEISSADYERMILESGGEFEIRIIDSSVSRDGSFVVTMDHVIASIQDFDWFIDFQCPRFEALPLNSVVRALFSVQTLR